MLQYSDTNYQQNIFAMRCHAAGLKWDSFLTVVILTATISSQSEYCVYKG